MASSSITNDDVCIEDGVRINGENTNDHMNHEEEDGIETTTLHNAPVKVHDVSWIQQMRYAFNKNMILLSRSPIMMCIMLSCNCISVLLAWWMDDPVNPNDLPPMNNCGTIDREYAMNVNLTKISPYDIPTTLNTAWLNGIPIAFLSLGPFLFACCVFMIVHEEIYLHLFEVLRGLSLRDSVYWLSWYLSFALIAILSALIGSITSRLVPVHVMDATSFGCVFASLFVLQLSLNSASFFLAALLGTRKRGTTYVIMIMMIALWTPRMFLLFLAFWPETSGYNLAQASTTMYDTSPLGLFWINQDTNVIVSDYYGNYNNDTGIYEPGTSYTCNIPIMSEEQGTFLKTEPEQIEVKDDDFFLGCYANAGVVTTAWDHPSAGATFGRVVMYTIPYFQFSMIWGNFAGMTQLPGNEFKSKNMGMTSGELAYNALPSNFDKTNTTYNGLLMPSGSTIHKQRYELNWNDPNYQNLLDKSNCPDPNRTGYDFCEFQQFCPYANGSQPQNGKSVNQLIGQLLAQAILYMLFAAYFGIKLIGGGSEVQSWFFPFQPSYWFGHYFDKKNKDKDFIINNPSYSTLFTEGVLVDNISKNYGTVEAVKGVTIKMIQGEVTALLGKFFVP